MRINFFFQINKRFNHERNYLDIVDKTPGNYKWNVKFNYIKAGIWHRPIIPVTIAYKNKEIRYLALIDSGADFNVFHKDIADILRIDLSKLKQVPFSGISPGINIPQGSFAEVTLQVGKSTTKTMVLSEMFEG